MTHIMPFKAMHHKNSILSNIMAALKNIDALLERLFKVFSLLE